MKKYYTTFLVKSEDLNHHGTLFAARTAAWFVESAFVAAACEHGKPEDIVCINVHSMSFKKPVHKGDIVKFTSRVVRVGTTSITVCVKVNSEISEDTFVVGYITFVTVDSETRLKKNHGIVMDTAEDEEEKLMRDNAQKLFQ